MEILFLLSIAVGIWIGIKRSRYRLDQKTDKLVAKKQGKKRRIDISNDAPEEMTQAELKAMGRWFS
jgi:hypothetical protein